MKKSQSFEKDGKVWVMSMAEVLTLKLFLEAASMDSKCITKKKRDRKSKRLLLKMFNCNILIPDFHSRNLDNSTIVRARTVLLESSSSSGRAQPSDSPLCAHYSNGKSNGKTRKRRKGTIAPTLLEYNFLYIPRILKNDLRRQYPMIFTNVFNSCEVYYSLFSSN